MLFSAFLICFLLSINIAAAQPATNNSTNSTFSKALNDTYSYIETVNESAYLVFYPNLTNAYNLVSKATQEAKSSNITYALLLLREAKTSASRQETLIEQSATSAAYVALASIVVVALLMYFVMKPRKGVHSRPSGKKSSTIVKPIE